MGRFAVVIVAVAVVGVAGLARAPAASACSCVAPAAGVPRPAVLVEGTALALAEGSEGQPGTRSGPRPSSWSSVWRFAVDTVERGAVTPGDEIGLDVSRGNGAGCGVDVGPVEAGRRYRVGGSFDEATARLHLNLCSSPVLEPLGPAGDGSADRVGEGAGEGRTTPDDPTDSTAVARLDEPEGGGGVDTRIVGAGIGAAAGASAGLFALRRRLS